MRAVLLATGYSESMIPLVAHRSSPLLRIIDRPIIEHIIDFLLEQGIKRYDIVLSHLPEMIEGILEDGKRWGVHISYHLAKDPQKPFVSLWPSILEWEDENILLGRADTFPQFQLHSNELKAGEMKQPHLFFYPSKTWSGWGIFPSHSLKDLPKDIHEDHFLLHFKPTQYKMEKALPYLSVHTFLDLQKSNHKLLHLKHNAKCFPATARMVEPGIWISRGTTLHPSVRIKAPVLIGESCQIKQDVQIGPNVVIENNCLIDQKSLVEESLICQRSYVGEGLEVRNCIVDRNTLINLTLHTHVTIWDDFILDELRTPSFREYVLLSLGRYFAALLLLIFSPLFVFLYFTRKIHRKPTLKLPAADESHFWKTFDLLSFSKSKKEAQDPKGFCACLPMLWNIVKGNLYFTGVSPRSPEEVEKLPSDWKRLYLKSKPGLITLAMVEMSKNPSCDDLYAAETYYTIHRGLWYDIKLCLRWLAKKALFFTSDQKQEGKE